MAKKIAGKKYLKEKIKELPENLSIASLALLFGLAERSAVGISEILAGPSRGFGRSLDRISRCKTFWDYYDELKDRGMKENSLRTTLWRLQQKGLVSKKDKSYSLTSSGLKTVKEFGEKLSGEQKEKTWDGKWRIIMFDIPEARRSGRSWLRWQLSSLDYRPLQKSVFIGQWPFDEDFYREIVSQNLKECIRLMTVGELDDEETLLKDFFEE